MKQYLELHTGMDGAKITIFTRNIVSIYDVKGNISRVVTTSGTLPVKESYADIMAQLEGKKNE